LKNLRHKAMAVGSMLDAVVALRMFHPTVVIIDTDLPNNQGIALAYGIEDLALGETHVILMDEDVESRQLIKNMPNAVFLQRPCTREALGRIIDSVIRQKIL